MEKVQGGSLSVRMMGGFLLNYEGKEIALGKNSTAKFIQLLQMVWLQKEKGITKDELMRSLLDREKLENANNSFNNLVYQMRRQMPRCGLPEGQYIVRNGGVYQPDDSISVQIDAVEFECLVQKGEQTDDEKERFRCYSKALELYRGELLPDIANEIWVTTRSFQLKKHFIQCTSWMGSYLKAQKDYSEMYRIYTKAAEMYPFDDWQVYQIDSLLCKGEYKQAYQLYNKTVTVYSDEMGLPPSDKMMECYEQMSRKLSGYPGNIEEIRKEIRDAKKTMDQDGAYYCSYPSFVDSYWLLSRSMERSGQSIFMMLCTLVDYEGKLIENQDKLKKRSEAMHLAIKNTLRRGDAYTRYNTSQYLILLLGIQQEDCYLVYRRISQKLKEMEGPRAEVTYSVLSLADLPDA
ncbi:MAG: bacterial transcriptional activator domain-containing protein [Lachnospiraceae bacterium]|nr:bacterial transcriptional activator domain-containing protein [Lachnospiraceae bacterium]